MAGFGSSSSKYGGGAGSYRGTAKKSKGLTQSFSPRPTGGGGGPSLGAPQQRSAPTPTRVGGGGPSMGAPQMSLGAPQSLPAPKPVGIAAPKPGGQTSINVSAKANPQLSGLLGEQKENIQNLKDNTGLASDATAIRTADAFEGAKNAAKYAGGEGGSGVRDTRQQQITDAGLRENARRQTDLTLGREGMITGAIQGQLGTIMGQQAGMLGQQGIGLQAEALRQQGQNNQFNQGLAGQRFGADVQFRNQDNAWRAAQQQMQGLQGMNQMQQGWGGNGWGGGGYGGGIPAAGPGSPSGPGGAGPGGAGRRGGGSFGSYNPTRINT